MVERRRFPAIIGVAGCARMIEVAGYMVWVADLLEVGLVAAIAVKRRCIENAIDVALVTIRDCLVFAGQRKT